VPLRIRTLGSSSGTHSSSLHYKLNSKYLQFTWNDFQSAHRFIYSVLWWSFLCTGSRTFHSVHWLGHGLDDQGIIPGMSKRFFSALKCPDGFQVPPTLIISLSLGRVTTVQP
jgi:hypothetical protein